MTKSCVRRLLRSSVLAETVLTVVAKAVRDEAVERETARAEIAVQAVEGLDVTVLGGEQTRQTGEETSRGRGNKQGVLCPYFLKNGSCKKGSGCDMVHALVVTENQQNTQSQGAATSSAPAATMSQKRLNLHFWGWRQRPCLARLAFWLKKFCRK